MEKYSYERKQENCCTPIGQIKRYKDCVGCDRKPKQETLEEAAEKWVFETNGHKWSNNDDTAGDNFSSFIAGAKWQQEQDKKLYNEVFEWLAHKDYLSDEVEIIQKEFEQFKNK
jgi:hypothetical protein